MTAVFLAVRDLRLPGRLLWDPAGRRLVYAELLAAPEEARGLRFALREGLGAQVIRGADFLDWTALRPQTLLREEAVRVAGLARRLVRLYLPADDQTLFPVLPQDDWEAFRAWVEAFTDYPIRLGRTPQASPAQTFAGEAAALEAAGFPRPPIAFALPRSALEGLLPRLF